MNEEASVTISVPGDVARDAATPVDALRLAAASRPDSMAFCDSSDREERGLGQPRSMTYAQCHAVVTRIAAELEKSGLRPGNVIALQAPNIVEVPLVILAAWRAGLVPCVMPVLWQLNEIDDAFARLQPAAALTVARYGDERPAATLAEAAARHVSIRFLFGLGSGTPDGISPVDPWFEIPDDIGAATEDDGKAIEATADDLALLTWTTGRNGNIPLARTYAQLMSLGRMFAGALTLRFRDVLLNPYPYSGIAPVAGQLVAPLMAGASTVLHLPFDFDTFLAQLSGERVTCPVAPAPVVAALEERRDLQSQKYNLRKIACIWPSPCGTEKGPGIFEPTFPAIDVHNFADIAVLARPREQQVDPMLHPLGKLRSGPDDPGSPVTLEMRIRGSVKQRDGKEILKGKLHVRGTTVPLGEYRPASADGPVTLLPDDHGFLDTGFDCVTDSEMNARFRCEKNTDVIHHGGTILAASELDALYAGFPEFLDAAVFALDDATIGDRIFAAVVPQPDLSPSLSRFRDYLASKQVAPHKVPDQLVIVKSIPRTGDGLVERDKIINQI